MAPIGVLVGLAALIVWLTREESDVSHDRNVARRVRRSRGSEPRRSHHAIHGSGKRVTRRKKGKNDELASREQRDSDALPDRPGDDLRGERHGSSPESVGIELPDHKPEEGTPKPAAEGKQE